MNILEDIFTHFIELPDGSIADCTGNDEGGFATDDASFARTGQPDHYAMPGSTPNRLATITPKGTPSDNLEGRSISELVADMRRRGPDQARPLARGLLDWLAKRPDVRRQVPLKDLAYLSAAASVETPPLSPFGRRDDDPLAMYSKDGEPHKFSSTQFNLDEDDAAKVRDYAATIPDEYLADDGREENPHVTVKYGLHTQDADEVAAIVRGFGPVKVTIGDVSAFHADEYDVLKFDVEGDDIKRLNKLISDSLECTDTHPTYNPHVTIAYVKPGIAKTLVGGSSLTGTEMTFSNLVFSPKDEEPSIISTIDDNDPLALYAMGDFQPANLGGMGVPSEPNPDFNLGDSKVGHPSPLQAEAEILFHELAATYGAAQTCQIFQSGGEGVQGEAMREVALLHVLDNETRLNAPGLSPHQVGEMGGEVAGRLVDWGMQRYSFDPSEPRDDSGKWTSGGNATATAEPEEPATGKPTSRFEQAGAFIAKHKANVDALINKIPVVGLAKKKLEAVSNAIHSRLAKRYGAKTATAIMLSGQAADFAAMATGNIIPGLSLLGTIPGLVLAEAIHQGSGLLRHSKESEPSEEDIERLGAEVAREVAEAWETILEEHRGELPSEDDSSILQQYKKDKQGHEHKGKGPGGGRFVSQGGSDSGVGDDDKPTKTAKTKEPPSVKIKPTKKRAFNGEPVPIENPISKQESGGIGEAVVIAWLKSQGKEDARHLNLDRNNFPIDLIQDHESVEAKTGLVSNGSGAQQWRLTIGEPGKKEKEWLAKASPEAKAKWNEKKQQMITERKKKCLADLSKKLGKPVKARTITVILNPDTKTADIYSFEGWHNRIGWNSEEAKKAYVGSVTYE